jgi:hypothetical protein
MSQVENPEKIFPTKVLLSMQLEKSFNKSLNDLLDLCFDDRNGIAKLSTG